MKEKNLTTFTIFKGVNMKKTVFVLALALALVFSVTAIAGAKYAGYFRDGSSIDGTPSDAPGYLSWGSATNRSIVINGATVNLFAGSGAAGMMNTNGVELSLRQNPHGGYTTATTKCAVCHSVHRAYANDTAGVVQNWHLTTGTNPCLQCHTTFGTGGATKLIEWAQTGSGPHNSSNCTGYCHRGGIHGLTTSKYWGMNAYLLGSGGTDREPTPALSSDAMIEAEVENGINRPFTANNIRWFLDGVGGVYETTVDQGAKPASAGMPEFAFGKSTATGYTCARAGCHTNSTFAINRWGVSTARPDVGNENGMATGHRSAPAPGQHTGTACFPCHPGNSLAAYTSNAAPASNGGVSANGLRDTSRSYGCDQCHDMVGVATGTTAWPHANRNIRIYEWADDGTREDSTVITSGNLWMYGGTTAVLGGSASYANAVNKEWRVMRGAVGSATVVGNIKDAVCLKCHLPVDKLSQDTLSGLVAPAAGAWTRNTASQLSLSVRMYHHTGANYNIPASYTDINADTGSGFQNRIPLWK